MNNIFILDSRPAKENIREELIDRSAYRERIYSRIIDESYNSFVINRVYIYMYINGMNIYESFFVFDYL